MTLIKTLIFNKVGHIPGVTCCFTSDDRSLICSALYYPLPLSENKPVDCGSVAEWDIHSGQRFRSVVDGQPFEISGVSDNGQFLGLRNGYVVRDSRKYHDEVIDLDSGKSIVSVSGSDKGDGTASMSPDGRVLGISTENGDTPVVNLINVATGKVLHSMSVDAAVTVGLLAFSPDSKLVAGSTQQWNRTGTLDGDLYIWDVHSGRTILHQSGTWSDPLFFLSINRLVCGNEVVDLSGEHANCIQVFNLRNSERQNVIGAFGRTGRLVLVDHSSANEKRLVNDYEVWDVAKRCVVRQWRSPVRHELVLAISPNGEYLATTGDWQTPGVRQDVVHLYRVP